jgi:hypothetical protein
MGRAPVDLGALSGDEARLVLFALLERHPALLDDATAVALEVVSSLDPGSVADEVVSAVGRLTLEALRAGRQRSGGYVEATEAALELLESVIEPFQRAIPRLVRLGSEEAALRHCRGIVLGLYRLQACDNEVIECAPEDTLAEFAGWTIDHHWGENVPSKSVVDETFVRNYLPEWEWLLDNR